MVTAQSSTHGAKRGSVDRWEVGGEHGAAMRLGPIYGTPLELHGQRAAERFCCIQRI